MKSNRDVIKEALARIQSEYLQNNKILNNPEISWVGIGGKISLLYEIALELLEENDDLLKEIEDTAKVITDKNLIFQQI